MDMSITDLKGELDSWRADPSTVARPGDSRNLKYSADFWTLVLGGEKNPQRRSRRKIGKIQRGKKTFIHFPPRIFLNEEHGNKKLL